MSSFEDLMWCPRIPDATDTHTACALSQDIVNSHFVIVHWSRFRSANCPKAFSQSKITHYSRNVCILCFEDIRCAEGQSGTLHTASIKAAGLSNIDPEGLAKLLNTTKRKSAQIETPRCVLTMAGYKYPMQSSGTSSTVEYCICSTSMKPTHEYFLTWWISSRA